MPNPFTSDAVTIGRLSAILRQEVDAHSWPAALETCRGLLSVTSKLFARLGAISELLEAGYAAAEVDRAMKPDD